MTNEEQRDQELGSEELESSSQTEEIEVELAPSKGQIEALEDQVTDLKDRVLRAEAEQQNIRRRAQKDVEKAHKFGLEKFGADLVAVVDNLERAVGAADSESDDVKLLLEGVELTQKSLVEVLQKHGVEQVDPHGEPFDPQFHQAMTMLESADVEPNTVIDVMQKGYVLNGRLIRPAMVVVSKA